MTIPRISTPLRTNIGRGNLATTRLQLTNAERIASTLMEVARPSDNPAIWAAGSRLDAAQRDQQIFARNGESARLYLSSADQVLGEAIDVLNRAQELGILMSNAAASASDREAAAIEIDSLREALIRLANTKVGDRYVFAGEAYDRPPFAVDGTYEGAVDGPEVRVGERDWIRTGIEGSTLFLGVVDTFAVLEDLADALRSNDVDAVRASLSPIQTGRQHLITQRSVIGADQRRIDNAINIAESMDIALGDRLAEMVQADPITAYSQLAQFRLSYEATLQVMSNSASLSLFNFLR
jgi:flagellar hook-associated protein 3 FlgL